MEEETGFCFLYSLHVSILFAVAVLLPWALLLNQITKIGVFVIFPLFWSPPSQFNFVTYRHPWSSNHTWNFYLITSPLHTHTHTTPSSSCRNCSRAILFYFCSVPLRVYCDKELKYPYFVFRYPQKIIVDKINTIGTYKNATERSLAYLGDVGFQTSMGSVRTWMLLTFCSTNGERFQRGITATGRLRPRPADRCVGVSRLRGHRHCRLRRFHLAAVRGLALGGTRFSSYLAFWALTLSCVKSGYVKCLTALLIKWNSTCEMLSMLPLTRLLLAINGVML